MFGLIFLYTRPQKLSWGIYTSEPSLASPSSGLAMACRRALHQLSNISVHSSNVCNPSASRTLLGWQKCVLVDGDSQRRGYCGKFVTNPSDLVSQEQADELIRRLRKEEIHLLKTAIQLYDSKTDKAEFEGRWPESSSFVCSRPNARIMQDEPHLYICVALSNFNPSL